VWQNTIAMKSIRLISSSVRSFQRVPSSGKKIRGKVNIKPHTRSAPLAMADPWTEVKDEASGMTYWWNQKTDETTHLGAPKPTLIANNNSQTAAQVPPPQQQDGGMMSGLGGMVAQGFAFGVGSSIARSAVNSIFDSGGDSGGGDDGDIVDL
jgi:hypothetical protein